MYNYTVSGDTGPDTGTVCLETKTQTQVLSVVSGDPGPNTIFSVWIIWTRHKLRAVSGTGLDTST